LNGCQKRGQRCPLSLRRFTIALLCAPSVSVLLGRGGGIPIRILERRHRWDVPSVTGLFISRASREGRLCRVTVAVARAARPARSLPYSWVYPIGALPMPGSCRTCGRDAHCKEVVRPSHHRPTRAVTCSCLTLRDGASPRAGQAPASEFPRNNCEPEARSQAPRVGDRIRAVGRGSGCPPGHQVRGQRGGGAPSGGSRN
jgi:hypothetical protein